MPRIKGVVNALTTLWKTGKPVFLANRADLIQPASQNFMRIALMTHVPDDLILRQIKNVMESHRELDNA